jgi:hypothetical protein
MKVSTPSCMDERDCQNFFSFTYRQEPAWVWGSWYIANVATCQIRIAIPNCQNKKVIGVAHWRNQHTVNFQSVSKVHASSWPKWTTLFSTHLSTLSSSSVCIKTKTLSSSDCECKSFHPLFYQNQSWKGPKDQGMKQCRSSVTENVIVMDVEVRKKWRWRQPGSSNWCTVQVGTNGGKAGMNKQIPLMSIYHTLWT